MEQSLNTSKKRIIIKKKKKKKKGLDQSRSAANLTLTKIDEVVAEEPEMTVRDITEKHEEAKIKTDIEQFEPVTFPSQ